MREETAELASLVLSDAISIRSHSPGWQPSSSTNRAGDPDGETQVEDYLVQHYLADSELREASRPEDIQEVSEPASPIHHVLLRRPPPTSALSEMIKSSPSLTDEENRINKHDGNVRDALEIQTITSRRKDTCQLSERSALLPNGDESDQEECAAYRSIPDLESQKASDKSVVACMRVVIKRKTVRIHQLIERVSNLKLWSTQAVWNHYFRQSVSYVPPVVLGLLLNILDALSYGD